MMDQQNALKFLNAPDPKEWGPVLEEAYAVKKKYVGTTVYFRGIIEFSNICQKNCFYCGIRSDNQGLTRYQMTEAEIVETALLADRMNYGSIVLQSGERQDADFIKFVQKVLRAIKHETRNRLGVTLSVGEQTRDTYARWFDAGAHRYLLRIETSNPVLYKKLHPACHDHATRVKCLDFLRQTNYQVGTGIMIGLPGQTTEDLYQDILFFQEHDVDMVGMGPYIPHEHTPLAKTIPDFSPAQNLELGLKMIALTRILLKDVNIASTTALQALSPDGRELGLKAGANVIMPNLTPVKYRGAYRLYDNKPCLDENAEQCRHCLEARIRSIGETVGYGQWGDSIHFSKRKNKPRTRGIREKGTR
ncbi:MAG TPA: [FeFe] hydrogenase H-cluster radical SAM maturase HydE [Candidatus Bathyarchaeia archaeon]|nr:[FeFe] hydrogenase H-cluster radical SAM maturase HydE [Candidatus Bathyarchaeia archaeon]